jgi:hypothetical protein
MQLSTDNPSKESNMKTIPNAVAARSSIAPDTVRAWSDHWIIQTPDGAEWRCSGVHLQRDKAETQTRAIQSKGIPARLVRPE